PPLSDRMNRMLDLPAGSPKSGLVELLQARYTIPLRAASAGCSVIREALIYRGSPVIPGPALAEPWIVRRRLTLKRPGAIRVVPHSVISPGCVTGSRVALGAPGTLNVAHRNVSPASSDTSIWTKSWPE